MIQYVSSDIRSKSCKSSRVILGSTDNLVRGKGKGSGSGVIR